MKIVLHRVVHIVFLKKLHKLRTFWLIIFSYLRASYTKRWLISSSFFIVYISIFLAPAMTSSSSHIILTLSPFCEKKWTTKIEFFNFLSGQEWKFGFLWYCLSNRIDMVQVLKSIFPFKGLNFRDYFGNSKFLLSFAEYWGIYFFSNNKIAIFLIISCVFITSVYLIIIWLAHLHVLKSEIISSKSALNQRSMSAVRRWKSIGSEPRNSAVNNADSDLIFSETVLNFFSSEQRWLSENQSWSDLKQSWSALMFFTFCESEAALFWTEFFWDFNSGAKTGKIMLT